MRILITVLLLCISAVVFAQVNTSFRGTLNIYQASGTSPNYEIRGIFNDTQGQYTSDSVDVGDVVFMLEGSNCVRLEITNIISTTGGIIRVDVTDSEAILVNPPLGNAAILEETPNYGFPTFVDGISNDLLSCIQSHFALQVDEITSGSGGIPGVPGNTQDTVVQVAHGLSLLDPVFINSSGNWLLANITTEDSIHMAIVTEVISSDTLILTYNGLTEQLSHGYTVGGVYFVQDDGTYATTVPTNFINDIAFYVVSDSTLYITEQRSISPMTDLNGIYSSSDTIPSGTIATAGNFLISGETNNNYYFSFNPENDVILMRGDSVLLSLGIDGGVFTDNNVSKRGLEYAASGYVTQPLSLTSKEYVDSLVSGIPADNIYTADGRTADAARQVEVLGSISFVDTLTNDFGLKVTTPVFSEEVAFGRLDATTGTKATLSESKNNIELRGTTADPMKLMFLEETAQGVNYSAIKARDTIPSNTDFILPNSNGSYKQLLETDGQGRTSWNYVDSDNIENYSIQTVDLDTGSVNSTAILDSTITTTDLAFTPLQGSGTSGQVAVYNGTSSLTSYATYTFNGTDNLTYYNSGLSQFTLGRFYLKYDSVNTAQQLLFGSTSRILSLPRSNSNGLIIYPAADNSTTSAALAFSTGRTNVQDANIIDVNTPQYIGSLAGSSFALNITNGISQNTGIDVSNGIGGGIDLTQTWAQPTDASTQKTEYYGIRLRPSINRNSGSNDNYYGLYIAPTLLNSAPANWKGIYNTTTSAQGYFLIDVGGANNYFAGNTKIGYSTGTTNYRLHVTKNTGNYPMTLFGPANVKFQLKGGTTESITWSPNNYTNYPSLVALTSSPSSVLEISAIGSTIYDATAIFSGTTAPYTVSGNTWSMIGYGGLQATPDAAFTISSTGIQGIGEYLLQTAENADTHLGGSTITFQAIVGESRLSQAWSNGTLNFYAGRFLGNGVNSAGGTNATNNYGIYTYATGGTASNWSIFSDDGNHYYEDDSKFGGAVATPTATVDIEGTLKVSSRTGTATTLAGWASNQSTDVTLASGLTISGGALTPADASTTNELQTVTNTSDATTHTVTLSNSGGSIQLAEGANISLTTSGTAGDGIVTISTSGGVGEANTASNLGAGAGVYEQKSTVDLQLNSLVSESTTALTIAEDDPNNTIDFTINTGAVTNGAGTLTTGDQVYDFVTAQGNVYIKDDTIAANRTVTIDPDYLFKIRATDTYSSSGYLNFGTLNTDNRFGFDFYDVNGTSSGRINSYYDIGNTGKNQLTIENVNNTELGRILMTHDAGEEELLILNKNGVDTALIRMDGTGTTIQDDNTFNVNSPNIQFTGSGFDVLATTTAVFTTPATEFTGTLRFNTDGSAATSLAGQDNGNNLTAVGLGYGLYLTAGTLLIDSSKYATQYDLSLVSGATNLTFSGASSPVTLNSSSGTDVTFTAGAGVGLTGTGTDLTIAATDASISNEGSLTVGAGGGNTSTIVSNTSGSTDVTISGGTGITVTEAGSTITVANSGDTNAADDITGTVASTQVVYGTGANTVASESAFVYDATNNYLGVGIAIPTEELHIVKNQNASTSLFIENDNTGTAGQSLVRLENSVSGNSAYMFKNSTGYTPVKTVGPSDLGFWNGSIAGDIVIHNDFATGEIQLATGGVSTPQVVLQADGDVGIGTTSPAQLLHVQKNHNGATAMRVENTTAGTTAESAIALAIDGGKYAAFELFSGSFATAGLQNQAVLGASSGVGLKLLTYGATPITFHTNSDGTTNERMVIESGGDVGIGVTDALRKLHVAGEMRVTDLTTDAPTQVVGADADGDFGALGLSGMSVVAGTLTATDGSITNEAWTIDGDDAETEVISNQTVKFQGAGIATTDYDAATNVLLITATETDGSVSNELQTITSTSDATSHTVTLSNTGGSIQLVEGTNITLTTSGTGSAGVVTIAATGGSTQNLSYDAVNREVDISGGGTSATIPLALDDGATEGLASFTAADFTVTSGNVAIDYTNGQAASGSNKGFLTSGDWTTFNGKLSSEVDGSVSNEGSLTVGAGGANTSTIVSNTSGSTAVTIEGGTNVTVTESGSTITIASTGGGADLTFTGASSPYTLNSSSGTDVTFLAGEGITLSRATNQLTIAAPVMTAATGGGNGAVGIVPQPNSGENVEFLRGDATWAAVEYTKNTTIENPGSSENVTLFYTRKAITIREVADVARGTSPSVTWQIKYATTRDSGSPTDLFSASRTTTSTSGATTTTFNDATIGAGNWIWLVSSATSGTNDELAVTLTYTID